MKKYSTLVLFYCQGPFDGYVCLFRKNGQILELPRIECTLGLNSHEAASYISNLATNIKNWPIPIHMIDVEECGSDVDIIYMRILAGKQELSNGYEWTKISSLSDLAISERDITTIRNAGMRRY